MKLIIAATALMFTGLSAYAAPPEGIKLSELVAKIEKMADFQYIDEIDWNDRGYYEVEYFMTNGAKVEIKLDPTSGEPIK